AVAVSGDGRRRRGPARCSAVIIARRRAIAVLVAVIRCGDPGKIGDDVFRLGLRDHFLALENASEQQPDDDQHDGDLDQGETAMQTFHGIPPQKKMLAAEYSVSQRADMRLKISNQWGTL